MEVVRRVSRTPRGLRGGSKIVKGKTEVAVETVSMAMATTSTPSRMSSGTSKERGHGGEGDSGKGRTSPVIKRRRLSDRTNKLQSTKESTPSRRSKVITPARVNTTAGVKLNTPSRNTRSRVSLETMASPSVEKLLSQEDSFLAEFSEQMMMEEEEKEGGNNASDHQAREGRVSRASEADMFEVSDEEKEEEVADSGIIQSSLAVESQQPPLSSIQVADESQLPATGLSSSECSGLPASFYQVKQGALEDLKTYVPPVKPVAPPQSLGRLVDEGKDVGPFYGLPSKVVTLYQQHKRVTELFDWQKACLSTQAVKQKTNLLYSLPTSSGKTMVAEIVMLQVSFFSFSKVD